MKTLDEVADAFWALAQKLGTEITPEDLLKSAKSHDPNDMPDRIIWGITFGKRWIGIRLKGGGSDAMRVAMVGELNGPEDGWHLILAGVGENQNLFDLKGTRATKAAYSALTTLVTEGSVHQTRGGKISLI
ncbi:MAG: hypothetical protein M5U26_10400 [Planctomycetota bacterium]|nr:hypothetical protein [Planctomycetota bacterium]